MNAADVVGIVHEVHIEGISNIPAERFETLGKFQVSGSGVQGISRKAGDMIVNVILQTDAERIQKSHNFNIFGLIHKFS